MANKTQTPLPPRTARHSEHTGAEVPPCAPGSIEQELDMCETGQNRGDLITHSHGDLESPSGPRFDMSEPDREGDELSGDDHSSGLQGGEEELKHHEHIDPGLPGSGTDLEEDEEQRENKRRAS